MIAQREITTSRGKFITHLTHFIINTLDSNNTEKHEKWSKVSFFT